MSALAFDLPTRLEATEPPEARGLARDDVRMLVARRAGGDVEHARFHDLPRFLRAGDLVVVNVSSDAAVEAYEGWGGYGSSKAALEQLSAILGAEHPELRVYAVDPGDMRTQMHQEAFPGEDISDRLPPEESVPGLLALIEGDAPSGLYRARDVVGASA